MKIIVVGIGKVGSALTRRLIAEGHSITVVDTNAEKIQKITEELDVMGIVGNGSSINILSEAGMHSSDVFIAVTGSDELNLLCCMFAKKAAHCHAIARVRNPIYSHELDFTNSNWGFLRSSTRNWRRQGKSPACFGSRQPVRSTPLLAGECSLSNLS